MARRDLPIVSGREAVSAFERDGWILRKRGRKGHMILKKPGCRVHLSVPDHKELDTGLLRSLIRDAGISVERFNELLRQS